MRAVRVSDVGDGLCVSVGSLFGDTLQIDCGSQQGSSVAAHGLIKTFDYFHGPDVFILSHFHIDHYNGLLYASVHRPPYTPWQIREVYFPRIPDFPEKEKFMNFLFAMN
ncbi:MAG: hypothetical protein DDT19_02253 [Syntrophomonadaceae bacterium]|nr:hypothetical protein [Bacillota bacterium]